MPAVNIAADVNSSELEVNVFGPQRQQFSDTQAGEQAQQEDRASRLSQCLDQRVDLLELQDSCLPSPFHRRQLEVLSRVVIEPSPGHCGAEELAEQIAQVSQC